MRRILLLLSALGLGLVSYGQIKEEAWARLPNNVKTMFLTDDLLSIQAFIFTCENYRALVNDPEANCILSQVIEEVFKKPALAVWVANFNVHSVDFWPWNFAFTQDTKQWQVSLKHWWSPQDNFQGGLLRPLVIVWGFLVMPAELDLSKPFRLWYLDDYGEFTP